VRIVFMGTPDFAVPTLQRLAASRHEIAAVLTNPDRPAGRGRQPQAPPVKDAALVLGLDVLQTADLSDPELAAQLNAYSPDLFAVVAFSILPPALLALPPRGSVNLHPSLLPAYRGAAPIIWAVINGEEETGITTFHLNERIDAGDILLQRQVCIGPEETAGELDARLRQLGADLIVETIDGLEAGGLAPQPQPRRAASRAPKLAKEDGRIDWTRSTSAVFNLIRGTNPVPGAFTEWSGSLLKIHRARVLENAQRQIPGSVLAADARDGLVVATGDGALALTEVQPAGRAKMEARAFVRGHALESGARFGETA
jgi:methionyl-tRNA formyltransferase